MVTSIAGLIAGTTIQGRYPYVLGAEIAAGGEGRVHALSSHADCCAKIYKKPLGASETDKLQRLIRRSRPELDRVAAWPNELIHLSGSREVVGFIMPAVTGKKQLHLLATPTDRLREFPQASFRNLVAVAANVAKTVAMLHSIGLIIGDLSATNILIDTHSDVRFIDCDSFSFAGQPSRVALPERIPPELQGADWSTVVRTTDHDAFALAVIVHELLYFGRHPYSGHPTLNIADAIRAGSHCLGNPHAQDLARLTGVALDELVGGDIHDLFVRAFSSASRPSPHDWTTALQRLFQSLSTCAANSAHAYRGQSCPWCRIESAGKPTGFARTTHVAPAPAQLGSVPAPSPAAHYVAAPSPPAYYHRPAPTPPGILDRIRDVIDAIVDFFDLIWGLILWLFARRYPIALTGFAGLVAFSVLTAKPHPLPMPPSPYVARETHADQVAREKQEARQQRIEAKRLKVEARQKKKLERDRIRQEQRQRAADARIGRSEPPALAKNARPWSDTVVIPEVVRETTRYAPVQSPRYGARQWGAVPQTSESPRYERPRRPQDRREPRHLGNEIDRFLRRIPGPLLRLP